MKKVLSIVVLFALLIPGVIMQTGCKKAAQKKNIGLQLYSLRDDMQTDPVGTVEKVGKIGYAFVETAGYADGKFYGMSPLDFKALVEKNGMQFISSHTGRPLPDSAHWDATMAWWDTCIDAHAAAGVKYIVQPFMGRDAFEKLDVLQKYCDYFNAVGEKCKAKGIEFGYHNHDAEFKTIDSTVIYDYMLAHLDPSKVFMQMDLWWVVVGGADPIAYFKQYPGRFPLWHVKDEKEIGASGKMDFKALFENAELAGMKYPIVEQEEYSTTPIESVKLSFEFLNKADYVK